MNILYYLEPWIELGFAHFRYGSLEGYLIDEMRGLRSKGHRVTLVLGEAVMQRCREKRLSLEGVEVAVIRESDLKGVFPDYRSAASSWYRRDFTSERVEGMGRVLEKALPNDFEPDVVIAWETPIPFFRSLYPSALVLNTFYGPLSRPPFPETIAIDPFGLFENSFPMKFRERLAEQPLTPDAERFLAQLRELYCDQLLKPANPFAGMDLRRGGSFSNVVLLPLQVSGYFAFDDNSPFRSQFEFVTHVLENIGEDIGVVVTEHGGFPPVINDRNRGYLERRFQNFIYDESFRKTRGSSQFLLAMVDAVVTVSSSVGLQALLWKKPVFVPGRSHLTPFSSGSEVSEIAERLRSGEVRDCDAAFYYLLTHYYVLMRSHAHDPSWFGACLERLLRLHRAGEIGFDSFERIDDDAAILSEYRRRTRAEEFTAPSPVSTRAGEVRGGVARMKRSEGPPVEATLDSFFQAIDAKSVISFDIFDTLVSRSVAEAKDVFRTMQGDVDQLIADERRFTYRGARVAAERRARDLQVDAEEVTLDQILDALAETRGLTSAERDGLGQLEREAEVRQARVRPSGEALFRHALRSKKRVVLVSDMYLPRDTVEAILEKAGYAGYERLFLSSEVGVQKRTGRLFEHVLDELGLAPSQVLHIGDNPKGDLIAPRKLKIDAIRLPQPIEQLREAPVFADLLAEGTGSLGASTMYTLVASALRDRPVSSSWSRAAFGGDARRLGYGTVGPLLAGFAGWLREDAQRRGITDLFFLAREGGILKSAFDLLQAPEGEGPAIRSHYLYASRRMFSQGSLDTRAGIERVAYAPSAQRSVGDLLEVRFGLDEAQVPSEALAAGSFERWSSSYDPRLHEDALRRVLAQLEPLLNERAREQSALLGEYLEQEGFLSASNPAVVDIGYKGTMQAALASERVDTQCAGYYLVTFMEAKRLLAKQEHSAYIADHLDRTASDHPFLECVPLIEFLLLSLETSAVSLERSSEAVIPVLMEEGTREAERRELLAKVHEGALAFVSDFVAHADGHRLDLEDAIAPLLRFIKGPSEDDARLFLGLGLEDRYGGLPFRALFDVDEDGRRIDIDGSTWTAGAIALADFDRGGRLALAATNWVSPKLRRRMAKFFRDNPRFFRDSKSSRLRGLGLLLHGR